MRRIIFKNSGSGFTLVELVISMTIIIILSTLVLANYGLGQYQFALRHSTRALAQNLRKAEEMAMADEGTGSFGIFLNIANSKTSYILFTDKNGSNTYDSGEELGEPIELEKNVKIKSPSSLHVVFIYPDPEVIINNNSLNTSTVITLESAIHQLQVEVNNVGLINIK